MCIKPDAQDLQQKLSKDLTISKQIDVCQPNFEILAKYFSCVTKTFSFIIRLINRNIRIIENLKKQHTKIGAFISKSLHCADSYFLILKRKTVTLLNWMFLIRNFPRGYKPDQVFFLWLEGFILPPKVISRVLDIVFNYPWSGLLGNLPSADIQKFISKTYTKHSKNTRFIALLNENAHKDVASVFGESRTVIFPDVASTSIVDQPSIIVKEINEFSRGRKIIALIGSLEKRKGILPFLEAITNINDANLCFVLAGSLSQATFTQDELSYLENIQEKYYSSIFMKIGNISSEEEFNLIINSVDILYLAYENFAESSNLLTKAAFFNKPVIVKGDYLMGERVRKFHLGECIDTVDGISLHETIRQIIRKDNKGLYNCGFAKYSQHHSINELKMKFLQVF